MKKRINLIAKGHVQGVCFRVDSRRQARILGLKGWCRNNHDGTFELTAEGEESELKELIKWCRQGPSSAVVDDIKVIWEEYTAEFETFSIKY